MHVTTNHSASASTHAVCLSWEFLKKMWVQLIKLWPTKLQPKYLWCLIIKRWNLLIVHRVHRGARKASFQKQASGGGLKHFIRSGTDAVQYSTVSPDLSLSRLMDVRQWKMDVRSVQAGLSSSAAQLRCVTLLCPGANGESAVREIDYATWSATGQLQSGSA